MNSKIYFYINYHPFTYSRSREKGDYPFRMEVFYINKKYTSIIVSVLFIIVIFFLVMTFKYVQSTGEMYSANINKLQFELDDTLNMYYEMEKNSKVDDRYIELSSNTIYLIFRYVDLGNFDDNNKELVDSFIEKMDSVDEISDIEQLIPILEKLKEHAKEVESQVKPNSWFSWYFKLSN
jgi:hypothetical protein